MMNAFLNLEHARSQLTDEFLKHRRDLPRFYPLNIHPWLAMSLMQKAIRRGRVDLALRATATLLNISPARLWRRICITAYEDIGVADVETVAIVTAALKGKRWRSQIWSEWAVASYLVQRMARTIKCRAADDLAVVCQWHPSLKSVRSTFAHKTPMDLLNAKTAYGKFLTQALAIWYAVGTDRCRSPVLPERKGDPDVVWEFLAKSDIPTNAVEIAREGFRKSNSILCPFVSLLLLSAGEATHEITADDLPEEELIGGVPCWAFDVHVREGNQAIARFLRTDCETIKWIVQHIPRQERFRVLGSMLFRIESGLVDRHLCWKTGTELRHMADLETGGIDASEMRKGLELLRQDLPRINFERGRITETVPKSTQLAFPGTLP